MKKKTFLLRSILLAVITIPSFLMLQNLEAQVPIKIYRISLSHLPAPNLGITSNVTGSFTIVGTSSIPTSAVSSLTSLPPVHNYLRIVSGTLTTYAAVFWQTGPDGIQHASFDHLAILTSNPKEAATFYYNGFDNSELSLGSF